MRHLAYWNIMLAATMALAGTMFPLIPPSLAQNAAPGGKDAPIMEAAPESLANRVQANVRQIQTSTDKMVEELKPIFTQMNTVSGQLDAVIGKIDKARGKGGAIPDNLRGEFLAHRTGYVNLLEDSLSIAHRGGLERYKLLRATKAMMENGGGVPVEGFREEIKRRHEALKADFRQIEDLQKEVRALRPTPDASPEEKRTFIERKKLLEQLDTRYRQRFQVFASMADLVRSAKGDNGLAMVGGLIEEARMEIQVLEDRLALVRFDRSLLKGQVAAEVFRVQARAIKAAIEAAGGRSLDLPPGIEAYYRSHRVSLFSSTGDGPEPAVDSPYRPDGDVVDTSPPSPESINLNGL